MKAGLVTIDPVKKAKQKPKPRKIILDARWAHLLWGGLALCAWSGEQVWHAQRGMPFSFLLFLKGFLLLSLATAVYQVSATKGFSFLGMFPLLWLSVSKFQWGLCSDPDYHFWLWLVLFIFSEVILLTLRDGKKLLLAFIPLWSLLTWFFPFSFLLPFIFLTARKSQFKGAEWIRWGGLLSGLGLFLLFRGWLSLRFDWVGLFDLLVTGRYAAFFLLGWLGLIAFPRKGIYRYAVFPMFLLTAGFLFWASFPPRPAEMAVLRWVLVFFAGFGWESFRRDLMDSTWHGRLVWFALGVALFGGVV